MPIETGPGEYWDSRFWRPPCESERATRARKPVKKFRTGDGLIFCKDLVWRIEQVGSAWITLSQGEAAEKLGVSLSFLESWSK